MKLHEEAAKHIYPLEINGLKGRVLRLPKQKKKHKRKTILIYGSHASIERNFGIAEVLNRYGEVIVPDLPGFGGMDSFSTIGMKPSIDNLADYLATFVKLESRGEKFTIAGFSLGHLVVTRMLDKYPELAKQVDFVVGIASFSHKNELKFSDGKYRFYLLGTKFFSRRVPAFFYRRIFLSGPWIRMFYPKSKLAKAKFEGVSKQERRAMLDMEVHLWHVNDVRTWAYTVVETLTIDQTKCKVDVPLWHVHFDGDQYFDNKKAQKNLKKIYTKVYDCPVKQGSHSPTLIATEEEASVMIPAKLKRKMSR